MKLKLTRILFLPLLLGVMALGLADTTAGRGELAWREGDWTGTFAQARPSLPGEPGWLESSIPIASDVRIRLFRVEDGPGFLKQMLSRGPDDAPLDGARAGADPIDLLREAVLWGGRRAFTTVHRTATRGLRDVARESQRLQEPRSSGSGVRDGAAIPLEGRPGFTLVGEVLPEVQEATRRDAATGNAGNAEAEEMPGRVKLPGQKAGLYVVEILKDEHAAYVPWLVTDLALLSEQDGGTLRLQAVKAQDGAPYPGGLSGRIWEGKGVRDLAFDGEGRAEASVTPGVLRTVVVQAGASLALVRSEGIARAAVNQRLYAFTERPLYRPGQEVFVKAILRAVKDGENVAQAGPAELPYRVLDPEDTEVATGKAKLLSGDTVTYGATIQLPGAGRLGLYRVVFEAPGGPAQAEFKVEMFQKPTFRVAVQAEARKVGVGDPMKFTVDAQYFYGAAVRSAKAQWYLYQVRPSLRWWDENAGPAPELKESGEVELDENGKATLPSFPAKSEGAWRMSVAVTDASGQTNSGMAQVRCATGDYVLLLSPDRELVGPRQAFKASVKVLDLEGNEVSGVPVTLKTAAVRFTQRGKEQETESQWSWSYQHRPGEVFSQGQGPVASLSFPKPGLHLLVAEARDKAGRVVEAIRPMTVAEEGTPLPAVPDLKAMADKKEYAVGETARILVRLPKPRLTLHVALEGETLGRRFTRQVQGTSTIVEIPVTKEMQPNVWGIFEIVSGGVRQSVEVPIRVPRVDKKLQIAVRPDKARYQPGETMKVDLEVKDHQGRPVSADLSLGVVDEAIYALSPDLHPDIFRFFHPTRRHLVHRTGSTEWSFWDLMRRQRPVWSLKQTKRGEFKEDGDKIRQNFKDTAHWAPYVAVGGNGRASVSFQLPDNLTGWRATAVGVTRDTAVGAARETRPASKPLQVSLTVPRTLSKGDQSTVIALVRNLSGQSLGGKVKIDLQGAKALGSLDASFGPIPDQGEYKFSLPVKADQVGRVTVTAKVEGGGLKDGERRSVEVVEPLVPASLSGFVKGGESVTIPAPTGAKGEAMVVLSAFSGLEQLMLPSLPYLIQYPYGCVEQTLSSFMPNVRIAAMIKQGQGPEVDWKKLTDLDKNIRDGVFKVYGYQLPNGGWGWWSPKDFGPSANPHTTGYALQSFAAMRALGYAVDERAYTRGRQAGLSLFQELAKAADDRNRDLKRMPDAPADAAFMLLSLVRTGEPVAGMLDATADKVLQGRWSGNHVLAMTALAAVEAKHPKAGALLDRLQATATQRAGTACWEGSRENWYAFHSGDVVPTVYALQALIQSRPQSPLIPAGEVFLASQFNGYGWSSTWTTSQVLELIPQLARVRKLQWQGTNLKATFTGGPGFDFSSLKVDPLRPWKSKEPKPGSWKLDEPKAVTLNTEGSGLLVWTYAYQVPGSAAPVLAPGASSGLRLEMKRTLFNLRTPQQTGNAKQGWVRQPWSGAMQVADEAWMELDLKASKMSPYAMLEVPIPAGLEPIVKLEGFVLEGHPFSEDDATANGDWAWAASLKPRIEVHPDKVTFLFGHLDPWGSKKVRILLRASLPGTYTFRPAKLSLMGNEAQWVTCPAGTVQIQERGSK